jgi:hypothetical protein
MPDCATPHCGEPRKQGRPPRGWVNIVVAGTSKPNDRSTWYCSTECAGRAIGVMVATMPTVVEVVKEQRIFVVGPERLVYRESPDQDPLTVPDALHLLNVFAGVHLNVQTATPVRVKRAITLACQRILDDLHAWQRRQDRQRPTAADIQNEAATGRVRYDVPRHVLEREGWRIPDDEAEPHSTPDDRCRPRPPAMSRSVGAG